MRWAAAAATFALGAGGGLRSGDRLRVADAELVADIRAEIGDSRKATLLIQRDGRVLQRTGLQLDRVHAGVGSSCLQGVHEGGCETSTARILERVRADGYATEDGEVTPGFASVAVSVRDHAGWPAAGIAITFPRENIPHEQWAGLAAQITQAAAELSRRIRGLPV